MNPTQQEKWKKVREKGQLNYIVSQGLLKWGVLIGIANFIGRYLVEYGITTDPILSGNANKIMLLSLITGAIIGLVMGFWSWRWKEKNSKD